MIKATTATVLVDNPLNCPVDPKHWQTIDLSTAAQVAKRDEIVFEVPVRSGYGRFGDGLRDWSWIRRSDSPSCLAEVGTALDLQLQSPLAGLQAGVCHPLRGEN